MWGLAAAGFLGPIVATGFFYIGVACLAAALTRRWWSGIAATPLPVLLSLGDPLDLRNDRHYLGRTAYMAVGILNRRGSAREGQRLPGVWLSDIDLRPLLMAFILGHIAVACLATAVTARWWSGIVVSPILALFSLGAIGSAIAIGNLVIGLPTAAVTAAILKQMAEPPDMELENSIRIGALVAAVLSAILAVMILVVSN